MMKYRKKPVEIEAIQLTEKNIREVYIFIHGHAPTTDSTHAAGKWSDYEGGVIVSGFRIKTLESDNETQKADIGDFIIRGVKGECYPCKPDIFELTYDKV
jgi:hypothetical protein